MGPKARRASAIAGLVLAALLVAAIGYSLGVSQWSGVPPQVSNAGSATVESVMQTALPANEAVSGGASPSESVKSPDAERTSAVAASVPADRLVIVSASIDLRVEDLDTALDSVKAAVQKADAEISDLSVSSGNSGVTPMPLGGESQIDNDRGPSSAVITIRVPADRLETLTETVGSLGKVLSQRSTASDVTEQSVDLSARLRNLRAEEVRLRSFFDRTDRVSDLLAVENELARVRGEIEAMDAQVKYLERQAALATLTVSLSEPGPVVQPSGTTWGLTEAMTRGIQATIGLIAATISVAIPLAFLALVLLVVVAPLRWLVRRRRAGRGEILEAGREEGPVA